MANCVLPSYFGAMTPFFGTTKTKNGTQNFSKFRVSPAGGPREVELTPAAEARFKELYLLANKQQKIGRQDLGGYGLEGCFGLDWWEWGLWCVSFCDEPVSVF